MISDSGAIPYFAETLYSSSHPSQENATVTLLNLSFSVKEPFFSTRGVLNVIAHISHPPPPPSSTASYPPPRPSAPSLARSVRSFTLFLIFLEATIQVLRDTIKYALKALFAISLYLLNSATAIHLGAVPALFSLVIEDRRVGIMEDTTAVVAQVAGCVESVKAFWEVSGIEVLADLLDPTTCFSTRTKENAVSALLNLVRCGGENVVINVREVVVDVVAALNEIAYVADHGSCKGKSKASELLKVLFDESGGFSNSGQLSLVSKLDFLPE